MPTKPQKYLHFNLISEEKLLIQFNSMLYTGTVSIQGTLTVH